MSHKTLLTLILIVYSGTTTLFESLPVQAQSTNFNQRDDKYRLLGFKRAIVPQTNLREAGRELHSLKLDIQGIRWLSEALETK